MNLNKLLLTLHPQRKMILTEMKSTSSYVLLVLSPFLSLMPANTYPVGTLYFYRLFIARILLAKSSCIAKATGEARNSAARIQRKRS